MKPAIYLSGNDSLPEDQYREQLQQLENTVRKAVPQAAIINPLKLGIPNSWNEEETTELRLKTMKACNAAIFGKGWVKGKMGSQEYFEAHNYNMDVFLENQVSMLKTEYGRQLIG